MRVNIVYLFAEVFIVAYGAAADAVHHVAVHDVPRLVQRLELEGVGMFFNARLHVKHHVYRFGVKRLAQGKVGQVAFAGGGQRAVKRHAESRRLRPAAVELFGRHMRPHGVAAGRPAADFIEFSQGFHILKMLS